MSKTATKPKKTEPTEAVKKPDSMGEIHRRIDSARDVLVGKVPDPKSQVEQITLALIYKFMGDMDDEAVAMGGKPTFFSDKNADLAWKNLFDPRLGGADMLKLYEKAIESFSLNEKFPELFRNIFKNAYLPYRDPETLKLFLKTINGFQYDHSERLGDAFEYLLSVLGSQGDAGQFRTPRHIIDFIVKVVDPGKDDKILDPACGTAGFLISAFKHVINPHTFEHASATRSNSTKVLRLTTQERAQLMHNIRGYDISPDMVRLSLVNLYLHGFKAPEILEYDTLTSDERWNEYYDVILANPPFMSPKGGIKPHKRFSVQSNRSEVLFVDYIAEHLTPRGRAGIIVPEGIIFQSGNAYKELRKLLVDKFLWAVVSLPAGVFNPYSGVKTSILFLDRARAEKSDSILFVKVQADGFDLGAQRRANAKDDLPGALKVLANPNPPKADSDSQYLIVPKAQLAASGDYNLSMDRYQPSKQQHSGKWPMVKLGDVCEFIRGPFGGSLKKEIFVPAGYLVYEQYHAINNDFEHGRYFVDKKKFDEMKRFSVNSGEILISCSGTMGKIAIVPPNARIGIINQALLKLTPDLTQTTADFLKYLLESPNIQARYFIDQPGVAIQNVASVKNLKEIQFPLPPLEVQREIVAEIESYRRVLDGAKQVVESYKPNVEFFLRKYAPSPPAPLPAGEGSWPMVKLGAVFKLSSGRALTQKNMIEGPYAVYGGNGVNGYHNEYFIEEPNIVIGRVGEYCGAVHLTKPKSWVTDNGLYVTNYLQEVNQDYLATALTQLNLNQFAKVGGQPSISQTTVCEQSIPLPPLAIQQAIVADIEQERALVEKNRELIALMQAKIKAVVERVWAG